MFTVKIEGLAAVEQRLEAMRQNIDQLAGRGINDELRAWESEDLRRQRPEAAQSGTGSATTTLRQEPVGADGWKWWEEQQREPGGSPEGGEFREYPEGHWRRRRRRRRRQRGWRRQQPKTMASVARSVFKRRLG